MARLVNHQQILVFGIDNCKYRNQTKHLRSQVAPDRIS